MKFPAFMIRHVGAFACTLMFSCLGTMPSHADKRVALIIGNGAYAHAPHLPNPIHDAEDVAAALKRMGFETIVGTDLNQTGMQDIAIRFARAARTADVALFYYSGHAMQFAGVNYLQPIDADLRDEADLRRMARADEILADLEQAKNLRILILDSCRDNPLADELRRSLGLTRGASLGHGLAHMDSPDGTIISYSTQAGRTAEDGTGRNSPYTTAFLRHIEDKDDVSTVFHHISANVYETTKGTQLPELSLSFFGEFYLNGKFQITVAPPVSVAPAETPSPQNPSLRVPSRDAGYSDWLASDNYHELFKTMVQQRRYPRVVEGRVFDGHLLYRAAFEPFPGNTFKFYSYHGMTSNFFAQRNRTLLSQGYKLTHKQSLNYDGFEFIQATWIHR